MSITIPEGGTVAGRSASVQIEQPDIGGAISQVGAAVAQKFGQIKAEQRAVVTEKTRLDMTKELGEERLRLEQVTDPAQIEAEWPQVQARIQEKYLTGKDASGRPLLTPQEQEALGLTLQDLGMKHGFALGERTVKLTESQATASWLTARADITTAAATADPDTMAALIEYGEAAIDRLPGMLPDKAVTEKQAFRAEVANARATAALEQDPTAFIAAATAGTYDDLGPERVAQLKVTAQAEADRRAAADAKVAEAETKKQTDAIGAKLDDMGKLYGMGVKVADDDLMNDPAYKAHPKYAETAAARALAIETPGIRQMTVAELDAAIAAERAAPKDKPFQAERLKVLEGWRTELETAITNDPKAAARDVGLPAPDLSGFDPANPAEFAKRLAEGLSFDAHLQETGRSKRGAIFDNAEKAELKAILDPAAEAGPKLALAEAILQGSGGRTAPVLAELEADPVFRRGVKLLGLTGDGDLTEAMLRGAQKLDGKTVVPPSRKDQVLAFDELTGGVFDDTPAVKAELMEAALALYADNARNIDGETTGTDGLIIDGAAYKVYERSLRQLLGAQADRNGDLTLGGLQEVNGSLTVLPPGVSVQEVEASWDALALELSGGPRGITGASKEREARMARGLPVEPLAPVDPMRAFAAASHYGGLPDLGTDPAARFSGLTMRRVGESDIYELVYEQGGRLITVPEQGTGTAYRFRVKDLIRGARP